MKRKFDLRWVLLSGAAFACSQQAVALDLSKATVVSPTALSGPGRKAIVMLIEEVEKRTQIRWAGVSSWPAAGVPVIAVGPVSELDSFAGEFTTELSKEPRELGAEGYRIDVRQRGGAPVLFVVGNDARGVMFGVGHLLRSLRMRPGAITLPDGFSVATAPRYRLRGHQLGYRPKTNSYDAWDVARWEQYIRDLILFGCNAIELIPPRSDDQASS